MKQLVGILKPSVECEPFPNDMVVSLLVSLQRDNAIVSLTRFSCTYVLGELIQERHPQGFEGDAGVESGETL